MNDVTQWILVGIAVAFVAIERALKVYHNISWKRNGTERRKNANNPGVEYTPGAATPCRKHGETLVLIKNELAHINRRLTKLER